MEKKFQFQCEVSLGTHFDYLIDHLYNFYIYNCTKEYIYIYNLETVLFGTDWTKQYNRNTTVVLTVLQLVVHPSIV